MESVRLNRKENSTAEGLE